MEEPEFTSITVSLQNYAKILHYIALHKDCFKIIFKYLKW